MGLKYSRGCLEEAKLKGSSRDRLAGCDTGKGREVKCLSKKVRLVVQIQLRLLCLWGTWMLGRNCDFTLRIFEIYFAIGVFET